MRCPPLPVIPSSPARCSTCGFRLKRSEPGFQPDLCSLSVPHAGPPDRYTSAWTCSTAAAWPERAPDLPPMRAWDGLREPGFVVAVPAQGMGRQLPRGPPALPVHHVPSPAGIESAQPRIRARRRTADGYQPAGTVRARLEAGDQAAPVRRSSNRKCAAVAPSAAPANCAAMNAGTSAGAIPAKLFERLRAIVIAGLAKLVEEVNQ